MTSEARIEKGLYWDRAWNLVGGCTPVDASCDHCWAAREAHMRARNPNAKVAARNAGLTDAGHFNGTVRMHSDRLGLLPPTRQGQTWAVWTDLFHEDVERWFILKVLAQVAINPRHTVLVLTKRAARLERIMSDLRTRRAVASMASQAVGRSLERAIHDKIEMGDGWPLRNLWLGVTVPSQAEAWRMLHLRRTPAAVRYVSYEPALGAVDWHKALEPQAGGGPVHWLIAGAESGAQRRHAPDGWFWDARDACVAHDVRFFYKQQASPNRLGAHMVKLPRLDGHQWREMP